LPNCSERVMTETGDDSSTLLHQQAKPLSVVLVMVCIYIFLFIERPWESVRYLQGVPIERPFALIMIVLAFLNGRLRIISSPTNKWVYGLLLLHFLLSPFAFKPEFAFDQGIEYAKMVLLYLLILALSDDERCLKLIVKAYVFSMMFYVAHSLWEYHNGRHDFKMGITRMLGVDSTFNDPNAFGASVVLSLPIVYALFRSEPNKMVRNAFKVYALLAVICIVLTGSRSCFITMTFLLLVYGVVQKGKRKFIVGMVSLIALGTLWVFMPDQKQERIRTLWDEDAGTVGAHSSAQGRLVGWQVSWKMFKREPITGVGAGGRNFIGYRMVNRMDEAGHESPHESHFLYGEVLAELGIGGALLFIGFVATTLGCCVQARKYLQLADATNNFSYYLSGAIIVTLMLLLLLGFSGHNFYRPLWLWLAAWAGALINLTRQQRPDASQCEA